MAKPTRIEGVDLARGLASLLMLQGHAFGGWASADARSTAAYAFTRVLGTLPLPAFLVLAGASLSLRVGAARRRGEDAATVRVSVVKRGLVVMAAGYLTSFVYALIDGSDGLGTLLRSDVLHVIGLSLVAFAVVGVRPGKDGAPDLRRLGYGALFLGALLTLLAPTLNQFTPATGGPLRYVVALFGDVPGVARMPLFPLGAWMAMGVGLGLWLLRAQRAPSVSDEARRAGAERRTLLLASLAALVVVAVASFLTTALAARLDHPLSRADSAVWANLLDLGARGALVLFAGALLTPWLPGRVRQSLLLLGRYSLWAYVFHVPFCYGRLAFGAHGALSMTQAFLLLIPLTLASLGVAWLRRRLAQSRPRPSAPRAPALGH